MAMTKNEGRGFTQEERDAFLTETCLFAKIATVNEDGVPSISPVWYSWDGESFLIISKERTGMVKNLKRDPRCGLLVDNFELPYMRVSVQGQVEFLDDDFDYVPPMMEMTRHYLGEEGLAYAERTLRFPRVPFKVWPKLMTSWNGGGFDRTFQKDTVWNSAG